MIQAAEKIGYNVPQKAVIEVFGLDKVPALRAIPVPHGSHFMDDDLEAEVVEFFLGAITWGVLGGVMGLNRLEVDPEKVGDLGEVDLCVGKGQNGLAVLPDPDGFPIGNKVEGNVVKLEAHGAI